MEKQRIRILLVDDHPILRRCLASRLSAEPEIDVIGEASSGREAIELTRQSRPDLVIMDVRMPGMNGIHATSALHREFPDVRVIGLSMLEEEEARDAMCQAGAIGFYTKFAPVSDIVAGIRACLTPTPAHASH
jgi:DNA-binding NarL/FixJ family response regulator